MNNFLSINKMARLLNFIEQSLDVLIPMLKHPLCIFILFLECDLPGKSVDLGLYSIVNNHITYLCFCSVDVHSN